MTNPERSRMERSGFAVFPSHKEHAMPLYTPPRDISLMSLGVVPYGQALALQLKLRAQLQAFPEGEGPLGHVICVEHPSTITLGKRGQVEDVLGRDLMRLNDVPLFKIDRGGEATAHEPGQLVIYPILRLSEVGMGVVDVIRGMAQCLCTALEHWGIDARYNADSPGLWTMQQGVDTKIASVGMRVSRGVSTHGAAINLTNTMASFGYIVACGMPDAPMQSVQRLLRDHTPTLTRAVFEARFLDEFAALLNAQWVERSPMMPTYEDWSQPMAL